MKVQETVLPHSRGSTEDYSTRRSLHSVMFFCEAPEAKGVSMVGDFNQRNPSAQPMTRMPDGRWVTRQELRHGHYRYLFWVDGQARLDPRAHGMVREANEWLDAVSLLEVS